MQPGCPHNRGGTYPALKRQSNVGSLTSPVPVVSISNGVQNNMVDTQYPKELKAAHGPDQWQERNTQSQQHFQHHQLESQASAASTGCQYPKPRDGVCTFCNSCHQISKKANSDSESVHVSAQYNTYLGTEQSVCNGSKHLECSNQNIDCLKGTNLSYNTGLQQKRQFDCDPSAGTSSAATLGDGLGIAAHTFPRESNANNEIPTQSQEEKTSLVALNCGQTGTKNLDHAGGISSMLCRQDISSPSVSGLPSTDKDSPVGETDLLTDDQIMDFIKTRCAYFRSIVNRQDRNYRHTQSNKGHDFCTNDRDFTCQSDIIMPKFNSAPLPTTCTFHEQVDRQSLNCPSPEGCTAAFGQASKEDTSKDSKANSELTKSKETGNCTTSASEKHSAGKLASAVQNSKPIKKEPVKKRELADFDLPAKKHFKQANGHGKHVYSDDCDDETLVCRKYESFQRKWYDKYLQNGITMIHYSLTALKELIASLENVEAIAKMDSFSEDLLQQYGNRDMENIHLFTSTEYPQILKNVAATCTGNEDESPVQHTAAPEMTVDELTEKHPNSALHCSSSQEQRLQLNVDKNLDDKDKGVSWAYKHMTEKKKEGAGLKSVESIGLDNMQGVTQTMSCSVVSENKLDENTRKMRVTEDQQHCYVIHKEVIAQYELNPTDKILFDNAVSLVTHQSEGLCSQTSIEGSVCSETDLSPALSESRDGGTFFVNIVKNPLYEDISDVEDPHYEDISEDEKPQNEDSSVERPSLTQVRECNNKQSLFENERNGQAQMKTEIISDKRLNPEKQVSPKTESLDTVQHCFSPCFGETDDAPSSVLKDEDETDDDWIVIPISMSELKFEPEDEDQDSQENVLLDDDDDNNDDTGEKERPCGTNPTDCELRRPSPKPVPASACSQIEVFETVESFLQAKAVKSMSFEVAPGRSTAEHEMDSEGEPCMPQNKQESRTEPEDPSETEDSCDYSSGSEHNYLTVSRELLKRSAPLSPETDFCVSENEGEDDEVTSLPKGQTRSMDELNSAQKLKEAKCTSEISKEEDVIIIHSDTEDENEQKCRKKAKRKRSSSSVKDSEDAACSQQKKYSPASVKSQCGAVKELLPKNRPLSADCPAPQCQSTLNHAQFKEETQTACPDLSHSTECIETGEQLIESKASSEHVQHKVNRRQISKEDVIIIDSDTDDDNNDQNYKNTSRKRLLSSGSSYADDAPCVQRKRHSSETGDSDYETTNERAQDTGHLIEPKGGSEHVRQKTDKQKISKREVSCHLVEVVKKDSEEKVNTKHLLPSGSEDSGNAVFAAQNRPSSANKQPDKTRLSYDGSPEKQPQRVHKKEASTLGPKPLIPHLVVLESSQTRDPLKLVKASKGLQKQGKDPTVAPKACTASNKKTDASERNTRHLSRDKKGRFACKSNPAHDRHHAVQVNVTKPRLVSRQLSLPNQDSVSSMSVNRRQFSEAGQSSSSPRDLSESRETSATSTLPKSKHSSSIPRQHTSASKLLRSHSYSSTSTKGQSSSVTMQSSARKRVTTDWEQTVFPIRRDRKISHGMEEDLRTTNHNLLRETKPGPSYRDRAPRQRRNSHKSVTPLMKKTKTDAIQWTKAINRDKEQRSTVGEGYKWSERPTKGSGREGRKCRSLERPKL